MTMSPILPHRFASLKKITWFPGHMASAKKEMRTMLDNIDVIVEVRDARLPYTSANADLQTLGSHKRRLVVFNKSDLANSNLQNNITDTLQQQGLSSMFTSAKRGRRMAKIVDWCAEQSPSQFQTTGGTMILVCGVPNVGKSSIINEFRKLSHNSKRAIVGPKPGVTRRTDIIKVSERPALYVVDTPGVMVPNLKCINDGLQLSLIGAIKDTIVGTDNLVDYLLYRLNSSRMYDYVNHYGLSAPVEDIEELLAAACRISGGLGKTEAVQRDMAATHLLRAFRDGKLGKITLDHI